MSTLPSNAITPTGEVHYCINCKYWSLEQTAPEQSVCTYAISLVTGKAKRTACTFERSGSGHCGPQAVNFVEKVTYPTPFYNQR